MGVKGNSARRLQNMCNLKADFTKKPRKNNKQQKAKEKQ